MTLSAFAWNIVAPLSAALANGDDTLSIRPTATPSQRRIAAALLAYYTSSQVDAAGIDPRKAPKCSFATAQRHREVQARRAPDTLRGRAEEGAGDAHVVVVGSADVHHQVGGRAQPAPAAKGAATLLPRTSKL